MWSMSMSLAADHVAPSYGLFHVPDVAVQAELTTTPVPSRCSTYSLRLVSEPPQRLQRSCEWYIPRVAGAADGAPCREQVAVVVAVVLVWLDRQAGQLRPRRRSRRDAGLSGQLRP